MPSAKRRGGRREVMPSRRAAGRRRQATFGTRMNVSVPISFGLPVLAVGLALLFAAVRTDRALFWVLGLLGLAIGAVLVASGKRL